MKNYDNFTFPVSDIESAMAFYSVLGLSVKFDFSDQGLVALRVAENDTALVLKDVAKFPDAKPAIWFAVDDVRIEYELLRSKGIRFVTPPFQFYSGLAAEFEDPFGNRLGITDYTGA
jgi:predicted enzyme related to lactoylglutathione lyase